jgi:hypothetical protein
VASGADKFLRNAQRIGKTGANCLYVKSCRTFVAQLGLDQTGGAWKNKIGC